MLCSIHIGKFGLILTSILNHSLKTLLQAWRRFRESNGVQTDFTILALGGRKDGVAMSNSLLLTGSWGVDVVETDRPSEFLGSINWEGLKSGRPADAIFEIHDAPR